MPRMIMHIDLDAFYAAVEQREHPEWKGLPVVVGADPKGGKGRGVVMTCSYEARKFGIRSAMPISRAYKLCPTAVFTPPNFPLYLAASEAVMGILRSYGSKFEQVSIDEAFIDVTAKIGCSKSEIEKFAAAIKNEIREKERLGCSIGVASNKLVAKMASDYKKPDGLTIVDFGKEKEFLSLLPVRKLIGVGEKTEAVLKEIGVDTIGELAAVPEESMQKQFGKYGIYLHEAANGMDNSEVEENYEMKSISRNLTFEEDTKDELLIFAAVDEMTEDARSSLMQNSFCCRTIGVRIRFEDFETHTKEKTLGEATTDLGIMKKLARQLLQPFLSDARKVRQVGIRLTHLETKDNKQRLVNEYISK
ncbi:DNA polymerase IV [Candidatus Woesearchaeota archaeon]|nr:DNA polymerase IV [Candidatus Woesearchaeota archaeon]